MKNSLKNMEERRSGGFDESRLWYVCLPFACSTDEPY
jgi:hypothetical protein